MIMIGYPHGLADHHILLYYILNKCETKVLSDAGSDLMHSGASWLSNFT